MTRDYSLFGPCPALTCAGAGDERSEVRSSQSMSGSSAGSGLTDRRQRLEEKARVAAVWIEKLPADDSRVRLLQVALLRRDEVLLDGILAELERAESTGALQQGRGTAKSGRR